MTCNIEPYKMFNIMSHAIKGTKSVLARADLGTPILVSDSGRWYNWKKLVTEPFIKRPSLQAFGFLHRRPDAAGDATERIPAQMKQKRNDMIEGAFGTQKSILAWMGCLS